MAICRLNGQKAIVHFDAFNFWEAGKISLDIWEEGRKTFPLIGDFFGVDFNIEEAKEFTDKLYEAIRQYEQDEENYSDYLSKE